MKRLFDNLPDISKDIENPDLDPIYAWLQSLQIQIDNVWDYIQKMTRHDSSPEQ